MTPPSNDPSLLVQITNDGMGHAEEGLRQRLLRTWLALVLENEALPGAIAFYTRGVRLVAQGSPVLDLLRSLEELGVRLIVCRTCLEFFDLQAKVEVGIVGGMTDILAAQWKAKRVVNL